MKKLTTLFILVFLSVGLFASPKIPFESLDDEVEPFIFNSNDGLYSYSIKAGDSAYDRVKLFFIKYSLGTNTTVSISITFDNKDIYDKFTKDFDLSEIETEFNNLQKKIIKSDIQQHLSQAQDKNSNVLKTDNIDPRKPYNTWYSCYCSPKLQLSDTKK